MNVYLALIETQFRHNYFPTRQDNYGGERNHLNNFLSTIFSFLFVFPNPSTTISTFNINLTSSVNVDLIHTKSMVRTCQLYTKWCAAGFYLTRSILYIIEHELSTKLHSLTFTLRASSFFPQTLWSVWCEIDPITQFLCKVSLSIIKASFLSMYTAQIPPPSTHHLSTAEL